MTEKTVLNAIFHSILYHNMKLVNHLQKTRSYTNQTGIPAEYHSVHTYHVSPAYESFQVCKAGMSQARKIWLSRHGESEYNVKVSPSCHRHVE